VSKRAFDIVGSALLLLVSSPILIGVAIAIRVTSPGNIIYLQERIGRQGHPFGMLKFRSMVPDADDRLESLLDAQGTSDRPLFKVMNDPRITPIGRFIRKYSLDEFPQLLNVLLGQMSLVGPRPQRAAEVALYDDAAHRRLIMKPGMSGLWQVSGRSNLSWDDAIRLDLYYVENWSMTGDLLILFRTMRAVASPDGAV
jgi:lipopolysaccharide/colanic/teichoic acid biosynthesis glycosyltransferase